MPTRKTEQEIFSECDKVVERKAAKLNLTPGQMWIALELVDDVERVSGGRIQGMALRAVEQGSELKLHSIDATYDVRILDGRLQCVGEIYGKPPQVLYESSESIAAWETIRNDTLWIEGWIESEDSGNAHYQNFDTCQIRFRCGIAT